MEWYRDNYLITDDKSRVQLDVVHRLLAATYWVGRRPRDIGRLKGPGAVCLLTHGWLDSCLLLVA